MTRLKALKISMVSLGVFYLLGPALFFMLAPDGLRWSPFSQPYEHLVVGIFAALGICLLMSAGNPVANTIIIDFSILSSVFVGASMTYDAILTPAENIHLFVDVPFFYFIAIVLIFLYPRGIKAGESDEVTAKKGG